MSLILIQKGDFEFTEAYLLFFRSLKKSPFPQVNQRKFHLLSISQGFLSHLFDML